MGYRTLTKTQLQLPIAQDIDVLAQGIEGGIAQLLASC
jgi:hypothetical protein